MARTPQRAGPRPSRRPSTRESCPRSRARWPAQSADRYCTPGGQSGLWVCSWPLFGAYGVAICRVEPFGVAREALLALSLLLVAHLPGGLSSGDDLGVGELPIDVARVLTVGGLDIAVSRSGHGPRLPAYNQPIPQLGITASRIAQGSFKEAPTNSA